MLNGSIRNKLPLFALPVAATAVLEQLFTTAELAVVGLGVPCLPLQPHLPNYHAGVSDQFVFYRAVDFDCTGVV